MKLFLDINTGKLSRTLGGASWRSPYFRESDITPVQLHFTAGMQLVTTATIGNGQIVTVAIKARPGDLTPLVVNSGFTLTRETAALTLNFALEPLATYLNEFVPASTHAAPMWLEIDVTAQDNATRETMYIGQCLVYRNASQFPGPSGDVITTQDGTPLTTQDGTGISTQTQ